MEFAGHDFMVDGLCRSFGFPTLEENLAAFEETSTASTLQLVKRLVAEEQLRHALPLQTAHGQSFRAVAKMLMTHSYKVWYLREALQRALLQRGIFEWQALREQSESPAERQGRLDDFFASWKESPRKFHPQGLPKVPKVASEASTELRSWKDRASRSRCTATTMTSWEWSNDQPSEALMEKAATRVRRRSSRFSLSSPLPPAPVPIESVGATVATEKFNYLAIFPHLAKRKPMPTRRLFMTEETSPTGSSWKIDEILVHRNQAAESVVAPSELSEARRLLEGEEPAPRRSSVTSRSMSISQSDPTLLSQAPDETFLTGADTTAIPRGMARQLMALPFEEFQERILKDREADGRDPSPQRLFDRHFRRHLAKPPMPLPRGRGRATTHGLPPLPQKGSNWEPEREHPAPQSPQSATYLRSCSSHFVLPELLPFFTGHSKVLDAENRQLTDKDVLAMSGILRHIHPSVINLGNNILLTDKSMVPFLESVLKQPPGCLLTLQFHRCALGYDSCVKLSSLLESEAAKNLRVLNLNGIALSLAVQVHLASSIREHDRLRELSLADTQLTSECVQSIAENHQLELLDFGWNSFDAECFAALGLSLSNNVTLRTLSLSRCASCGPYGPPMATFLEHLSGIQNLQDLDISSNLIDHRGALMLEDVLANHQNLKKMNVSDNPLGQLGLRSLLRLLCTPSASLRRFEVNGLSDDFAHMDLRDPFFRPSSPGGVYQLDLTQPYHRSILRMLCKTAEHLHLQLSEALSSASGGWPVPEKVDGNWLVHPRGAVKLRFNVEKAMGKGLTQAWDFSSLVKMHVQSLKRRVQRKQIQLLLQFWSLRCQIQEQSLFLNALSKDFFFDAPQILQLCCEREVAAEVIWRLWHCNEPGGHYLSLLQGSPHLSAYVNVLRRSAQLLNFNPQNPSGHYSLDLANCSDFELGQRLLILDRWEGMLRSELRRRDVGRRPGSCIFDECFNGEELTTGLLDWRWHEKGILDLDYGSGKRLPGEEAPIADEQFRKLCQALLCSQLSPEAKVEALRPVSHHFNFSAFQLRSLCLQTASPSARAELFEIFLQRVVDIQNLKLVLETLEPSRRHPFRLNQCMTFPYIQPEDYDFEFNLKYADHRLACLVVFKLCEAEGWSSVEEGASYCSLGEDAENDEANFWRSSKEASLDNLPLHGIFKGKYLGFLHGNRNLKCRRQLLESFGFWPGAGITEDQVCWCSRPDAPPEIFKLVQWLMLHYPDVNKAFAQIIKKVPNGVQTSGSMTATEFDEAMAALKIQRLDEHGVDAAYRYLSSNDSLTQAMWKKLDPFVVTFRLHAQDFTGFMRSIAGEALEDWWQLIAQTAPSCSTQVGLQQWNDACRTLGFHGDSTLTYQLLEEEGNSISWTDFNQLLQFR